ncbi:trigger factor [Tessaracoccus bendigoensis DSM 12906]|uniref:Trigger factor n=1 Tax=Tessaracoccus bendigoensis DSM 12906 TaxID=1123357 RepID=A0A1M6C0K0_9ACTN|nr:trigger factor [Tessaracoccus bendigoensis]SHI54228.1 trigger factor [Tessaracoccus bendigoensis DSM 12906]
MPSTVEKLSPTRVKLTVEIPFTDLQPYLDKAYKGIAEQVNIPGFRKGKVPSTVIDQRFGRGAVLQEAINEAIPAAYNVAIDEAKVWPMAQPQVDVTKLEDKELVEFTAEVDIRPEVTLPDLSTVEVTVDAPQSADDFTSERLELLRQRFATTTEVDRAAKDGDVLSIDLVATQDGEELPDATAEAITYKVGEEKNMLEGLDAAVTGLKAGESKKFTSTLVGGQFRGQDADIEVTVKTVSEQELPDLDDDFAQMISEFDTVEEMQADLRKAAEQQVKAEQLSDARDKVLEAVVEATDFELPEAVLAGEKEGRRAEVQRQLAQGGLTVETYLEQAEDEEAETADEFWASIDTRSTQALRAQVILDVFADENKVDVSQQELTEMIFRRAQQNGSSPQDEINHMMEHNHMAEWMQEIRRGKALAQICAAAKVTDTDGNVVDMSLPTPETAEDVADEVEEEKAAEAKLD